MSQDLWSDDPELQKRYQRILAQTRRLQAELGIKPRTIEERYQDYLKRQEEEKRRQEELKKFQSVIGQKRPIPNWRV